MQQEIENRIQVVGPPFRTLSREPRCRWYSRMLRERERERESVAGVGDGQRPEPEGGEGRGGEDHGRQGGRRASLSGPPGTTTAD